MIVIPAIDIIKGNCVRLRQGDYRFQTQYSESPLKNALKFEQLGFQKLHLIDLDGAKSDSIQNLDTLKDICQRTSLEVDFGGGLKNEKNIEKAFELGVRQVNIGSIAIESPDIFKEWLRKYGSEKIILSADTKNGQMVSHAWITETKIPIEKLLHDFSDTALKYIAITDIMVDGTLRGPNFKLFEKVQKEFPNLKIIASGGIGKLEDIERLNDMGIYACIVGKAIYEQKITPNDLIKYAKKHS
ncbi:MAG: 1-(5-phosphoribosyl)-5-[(5-phosphoribosylamino)methylideneamino]imidazole-4-carboxamide isomerase [Bacteroidales bacterium]